MLGLERAFRRHTDIGGLFGVQLRKLHADPIQMQAGDFLVQMFGQDINVVAVFVGVLPQFDLRQHLVGKGGGHHEGRVPGGIAKVQQTPFGEQDQTIAVRHLDHVYLFFDVGPLVVLQRGNLDFIVEMADIADDRHVLHLAHMLDADHVLVAGGGDEDIGGGYDIFQQHHFKTVHRGLQRADGIDFGDLDARASTAQRRGRAFAHIAIAHDDSNLTGHHRVGGAADTVHEALFTAVFVIELRLGDRVVHIDRGEGQLVLFHQIIETVHAGGGLFGYTFDLVTHLGEPAGAFRHTLFDLSEDRFFFLRLGHGDQLVFAILDPRAQ